jgi:two-component sensor histidine kinase
MMGSLRSLLIKPNRLSKQLELQKCLLRTQHIDLTIDLLISTFAKHILLPSKEAKMSISIEHGIVGRAESDHRVANNLASLSGAIRLERNAVSNSGKTFTADQVCSLLDDIGARIEVTAKLHKLLAVSENSNGVNLGDLVKEIAEMIGALGSDGKMELTIDTACDGYIDPRYALHAGLITAELLTNAMKYAHPTGLPVKVNVRCETKGDGSFVVEVTDDGVGFPENFDPSCDGGLGFQLMRALAAGLNAKLKFEHDSLGVCARLSKARHLVLVQQNKMGDRSGLQGNSVCSRSNG